MADSLFHRDALFLVRAAEKPKKRIYRGKSWRAMQEMIRKGQGERLASYGFVVETESEVPNE
jgi:hypothetical protein